MGIDKRTETKWLNRDSLLRLRTLNFSFNQACDEIIFLIDSGAKDVYDRSPLAFERNLFLMRLTNAIYRGSIYYEELKKLAGAGPLEEVTFDIDFDTGVYSYEVYTPEDGEPIFDAITFFLNSCGFNEDWKRKLREINEKQELEIGEDE